MPNAYATIVVRTRPLGHRSWITNLSAIATNNFSASHLEPGLCGLRLRSDPGGGREAQDPIDVRKRVRGAGDTLSGAIWGSIADTRPSSRS
jgi:hypothetical protein